MTQSQLLSTHTPVAIVKRTPAQNGLLSILLIGAELRVEALRALLSRQEDMRILSPISDYEHASDIIWRMSESKQSIDVVVMDWDGSFEMNSRLLQALGADKRRVLVISSLLYPSELHTIEECGALGFCYTGASPIQLANAVRKVAGGKPCFYLPESATASLPDLKVRRQAIFCQERLVARAAEIGWTLNENDINIISHFDCANNDDLAERVRRQPGTIRTELSARIFLFLQLLSGRRRIPNKKVGYQVLLEFGIFEYL